jgi:hypothetical protein
MALRRQRRYHERNEGGIFVTRGVRSLGCVLSCAALLAAAPAAHAGGDYHALGQDDAWEVGTGTDDQGNAYCSIQDQSADQSYGLLLLIYPLGDDPSFEVHAFKDSWKIPASADVPTKFNFSDGGSWDADGAAASDGSSVVDYTIDVKDMKDFLNDFAQSTSLDIVFTNGTEPTWTADLSGTAQATTDLLACTEKLLNDNGQGDNTQPFSQPNNPPAAPGAPPDDEQPYSPPDNGGSNNNPQQQTL